MSNSYICNLFSACGFYWQFHIPFFSSVHSSDLGLIRLGIFVMYFIETCECAHCLKTEARILHSQSALSNMLLVTVHYPVCYTDL